MARTMGGYLKQSESAVRSPTHAHVAVGPRLARQPLHDVEAVELFLQAVLIGVDAFGSARTASIQPDRYKPALGEIIMVGCASPAYIVFAIGMVHHDRRE